MSVPKLLLLGACKKNELAFYSLMLNVRFYNKFDSFPADY